jgi:anion-transporting  ArsA/GET3 family ATPase
LALESGYHSLKTVLKGDDCTIALVFNPDMLSLKESVRLVKGFEELGLPLRLLLHNKISPDNREAADRVENEMRSVSKVPLKRVAFLPDFQKDNGTELYNIREDLTPLF